jgi:2,7-dihydroxy-5-methyl-1-naphthoate 7-O-methyltransferase
MVLARMWELLDLQTPWCMHVVATLRIADHIAAGTTEIGELAAAAGCDAEALHNVLGYLVGKGVFEEPEPGRFALNELAEELREMTPFLALDGLGGRMVHAWSTLETYVRTGRPGYAEKFGLPWWEDLAAHPDIAAQFDAMMGPVGHGPPDSRLELAGGWDGVRTVVDVGGGTGSYLAELIRERPGVRGILVDLPGTVARSADTFAAAGVADRITTSGQSFFDPLPAGADLYMLNRVLNDWHDAETDAILRRCAEAVKPGGSVVVNGGVRPDEQPQQFVIEMLLVASRIDTLAEFTDRAARAGLEVVAAGHQPSGYTVECRPMSSAKSGSRN